MKVRAGSVTLVIVLSVTLSLLAALSSCAASGGEVAESALQLAPEAMANRQMQTRRFDTRDEKKLLIAAASLLQDMGYMIEECESGLGVIVGDKDRDATDSGQIAGAVVFALLTGVAVPVDHVQKIRAALVTRPSSGDTRYTLLRVTFQRVVWNDRGQVSRRESLVAPELYQQFFAGLSKAVFLEAHNL